MTKTILAVDDSKTMRDMVCFTFRQAGYAVIEAANGEAAMKVLAEYPTGISCVITDLQMPGMGGIGLTKAVRDTGELDMPIVMLGTEGDDLKKQAARNAGVNTWVAKPFNPAKLVTMVQKVCAKPRQFIAAA